MRQHLTLPAALALTASALLAQTTTLRSTPTRPAARTLPTQPAPAARVTEATLQARLIQADATRRGELWLEVSADAAPGPDATEEHVTLRIPLASTEDVYGESRACTLRPDGTRALTFTAGMDEANFLRFAPAAAPQAIHLLLNKYLCRALAAPFHCNAAAVALPQDWSRWTLARTVAVVLTGDAPAALELSPLTVLAGGTAFDAARCAVIAPSNGMCCVAGKATEWHCGGTPAGPGWHQVSGECFHRETGPACDDTTVFAPLAQPYIEGAPHP